MEIPENPDIVGVGGVFNYALVKTLAEANPDFTALLIARAKDGVNVSKRVEHFFNAKIQNPDDRKLIELPENVTIIELEDFLKNFRGKIRKLFLPILPSNKMRDGLENIRDAIGASAFENCEILSASKGMENSTQKMVHEIIEEVLGIRERVVVMLGGNLAFDLARGIPMISELAGDPENVARVVKLLQNPKLRIYESLDKNILDIAGPIKNVHSLAAGIATAFSDSTVAAVVTRGLAEYERVAAKISGCAEIEIPRNGGVASDYNLLYATRNFAAGKKLIELLISGKSVEEAIAEITREKTIEGVASAAPLRDFVKKLEVEAPLLEATAAILKGEISVRKAATSLTKFGRDAEF